MPMMVGFMGNFLPARAGEVLRPYLLTKKIDISFSAAFASIVVERIFDLIMMLLLFAWVLIFSAGVLDSQATFSGFSVQEMAVKFGQAGIVALGILILFIFMLVRHKERMMTLVFWVTQYLPARWSEKIGFLLEEFSVGCAVVRDVNSLIKIFL
jgi:glycosyltransferase 2 family protein